MFRRGMGLWIVVWCAAITAAQDLENLQIHGFATQGFLYSSSNNYLTMKSSEGSLQWTEGALSISDTVTDKLRIGIQLHMSQIGEFGGPKLVVDWASGDYRFNDRLGVRVGKIKTPMGLYNDSQDVDSLFLWVLLPQAMYPVDNRDYNLSEMGGEVYGSLELGEKRGRLQYRGHMGGSALDENGGYVRQLQQFGMTFPSPPNGMTYGGDLRWGTPLKGLTVGSSAVSTSLDANGPMGSMHMPAALTLGQYAQWDAGKLHLAAEYWRSPLYIVLTAPAYVVMPLDSRAWYPMVSYDASKKLQVGTYYSHYVNKSQSTQDYVNYSKDWVVSARCNFNSYFYGKLEGHFLHGTGLGYYQSTNPNGLKSNTKMLAARLGFSF
jgi:hypothetical protein